MRRKRNEPNKCFVPRDGDSYFWRWRGMKTIIKYQCEKCGKTYNEKENAENCENGPTPELLAIGTIFTIVSYVDDIVFAIIKQRPKTYGHHHAYSTWACRDTPAGDNVGGEDYCGFESWSVGLPPNKNIPAYDRMVKALKEAKIKPVDFKAPPHVDASPFPPRETD